MTADEILQVLDGQFEIVHHDPPHLYQLWTHFYPADTRLTAFRSADRWEIVFEVIGYSAGPQAVRLDIYVYGNGIEEQSARYESTPVLLLDAQSGEPLTGNGSLDPQHFSVLWNGLRYDFAPSDRDYSEAGIVFDPARPDPGAHANAQIVRYLCERLNHAFFLAEDELRALLAQSQPEGAHPPEAMTLLLQSRAWRHPNLSEEELPSRVNSFRVLAQALVSGDASEWERQDPSAFNTDWRVYDWEEKAQEEQQREWEARQDAVWDSVPAEARERLVGETRSGRESFVILPGDPEGGDAPS